MIKYLFPSVLILGACMLFAAHMNGSLGSVATTETSETAFTTTETTNRSGTSFRPEAPGPRAAVIKKDIDDHFWADSKINKKRVRFLVDTGASSVALTRQDARRIGIKDEDLKFDVPVRTAGGETKGAFILIDQIAVGNVVVEDVEALVLGEELNQSLLGMSFMGKLYSYEVRASHMIIRQKSNR